MKKNEIKENTDKVEEFNAPAAELKEQSEDEIEFTVLDTSFTYGEPRLEE